jgi:hypothetical protein
MNSVFKLAGGKDRTRPTGGEMVDTHRRLEQKHLSLGSAAAAALGRAYQMPGICLVHAYQFARQIGRQKTVRCVSTYLPNKVAFCFATSELPNPRAAVLLANVVMPQ